MQNPTPISFSLEWLTADDARLLLMNNPINRRVSPHRVGQLAADMTSGRWGGDVTPQPIQITDGGRLIDGQHRLRAIIQAAESKPQIAIPLYIARNVPEAAFDFIDTGGVRSAAQTLSIHGFTSTTQLAAAARQVIRYERFPNLVWATGSDISKAEVVRFVQKHSDEAALLDKRLTILAARTSLTATGLLALHWLVIRLSAVRDAWDPFADGLIDGVGLHGGDPRLTLRNRSKVTSDGWGSGQGRLGVYIKAWNAFVENREPGVLRFARYELPMPVVR